MLRLVNLLPGSLAAQRTQRHARGVAFVQSGVGTGRLAP
jgi:hypothetical protein